MAIGNGTKGQEIKRKPYVKPVLECTAVYEASGATCCKVTNAACSIAGRGSLGKTQKLATVS
jgi:hypothetical protein